jgi:hypothetical protein
MPSGREAVIGMLDLSVSGGDTIRTPLTFTLGDPLRSLIRDATISLQAFAPSDTTPALLSVSVGWVTRRAAVRIEPVERVDLHLSTSAGTELGLLARLRDLLPGRYVFGLTGRGPDGSALDPGRYRLTIVATPTDGGPPSRKHVDFQIK